MHHRLTTSRHYFVATAAVYVPCWTYPWLRTCFEYGTQKARIFVEDNGFTRITIPVNFTWQPGQHCFLRFYSLGIASALTSHPFTICSLPSADPERPSELIFYIRHRGGFTARLYHLALKQPGMQVPVLVDGPYGGIDNQKYFHSNRLVVIAGGAGAGWSLPFVEQFLRHRSFGESQIAPRSTSSEIEEKLMSQEPSTIQHHTHGPRSLYVILATRDIATQTWFQNTLNQLMSNYKQSVGSSPDLTIEVHLTGEAEKIVQPVAASDLEKGLDGSSSDEATTSKRLSDQMMATADGLGSKEEVRGRPNLPAIIEEERRKSVLLCFAVARLRCRTMSGMLLRSKI